MSKYNKSSLYILPMIARTIPDFPGFVNCYIRDINRPKLNKHIFIVQDEAVIPKLFFNKNPFLLSNYSIKGYKVWVYKTPDTLLDDYYKFIEGKYSQFSERYKKILCKTFPKLLVNNITGVVKRHPNYAIIYPTIADREVLEKELGARIPKDAEIYSSPNLEEETFDHNKYPSLEASFRKNLPSDISQTLQ